MALKAWKMWSNGIKTAIFFQKITKNCLAAIGASLLDPHGP